MTGMVGAPFKYLRTVLREPTPEEVIWALRDVSFEVKQGEVVGIIGRNGAGKSTLLKILSQITEPTCGYAEIRGRVGSLLEVGTGFHPDLTGRENTYLNGTIMGMTKREIDRRFDEIVAFAEVEKFIDTPVRFYSSGMYTRLAFAVAAHLQPEILIVDEVLAVGDISFQKKCLGKMEDIAEKEGRTVLFVSHNLSTVKQLCTRAVLLFSGKLTYDGTPTETVTQYMQAGIQLNLSRSKLYKHIKGDGRVQIQKIFVNELSDSESIISIFEHISISIDYKINHYIDELEFFVLIYSWDGEIQSSLFQKDSNTYTKPKSKNGRVTLKFNNFFMPGRYLISAGILDKSRDFVDWVEHVESFYVEPSFNDGRKYDYRLGKTSFLANWNDD
jgi:lipopolysaccharide transport system ATP-binding protein